MKRSKGRRGREEKKVYITESVREGAGEERGERMRGKEGRV